MTGILTPALQMLPSTIVRKRRYLPVTGEILFKVGDSVAATQAIGTAQLPGELTIVRLPEMMGLQIFEVLKGLKVSEGDMVTRGEILSEHAGLFGLFRSRATAPVTGVVEMVIERTGHIGIRQASVPIDITAYISGKVVEVEEGKGVLLEAEASLVQGIFGIGGEKVGIISVIAKPEETLSLGHIPEDCSGKILVGGQRPTNEIVQVIAERGGVGLVTGSLDDTFIKEYLGYDLGIALTGDEEVPVTVIMTEGFGSLAMSKRAYTLLEECEGLEASINGATQVRAGAVRPEVIVPRIIPAAEAAAYPSLTVGATIRIIRVPYFGKRATVTELPAVAARIETGAKTRVLKATLEDGTHVTIPRANVELV